MPQVNKEDYRLMIWFGLAVLILEVLVVVLRGGLPILLVFLLVDSSGVLLAATVRLASIRTGQRKVGLAEQQSRHVSIRGGANRAHAFQGNNENRAEIADLCRDHEVDWTRGDEITTTVLRLQREDDKTPEDDIEALELLRQAGFTATESDRLWKLRKRYVKQEGDQTPADLSRLKFVRWLVATGKLTDQL